MFNLYIGKQNLPTNKIFVEDVEAEFIMFQNKICKDHIIEDILKSVDKATWQSNKTFKDRNGYDLYYSELSTGCKACLLAYLEPNKIINFTEAGSNTFNVVEALPEASMYLPDSKRYKVCARRTDLSLNGVVYDDAFEMQCSLEDGLL